MEYKQLLDISNTVIVALVNTLEKMGLNGPLICTQMADSLSNEGKYLLDQAGLKIEGTDPKSVSESFVEEMKKLGATQRVNLVEVSDSKIVVDLGECVFAPATAVIRKDDPTIIPPCPFIGLLIATLNTQTGKQFNIEGCTYKPELNTSIFTLELG